MKIKQKNKLSIMLFGILLGYSFNLFAQFPSKKEVVNQMRRVADYQMAQQWSKAKQPNGRLVMGPKTWEAGAFYPGILEVFRQTKDKKYLNLPKTTIMHMGQTLGMLMIWQFYRLILSYTKSKKTHFT
jgi:hypothetical protein